MDAIISFVFWFVGLLTWVQWLAIFWSAVALYGMSVNLDGLHKARGDLHFLQDKGLNGFRSVIAHGNVRHEAIRATIQFLFVLIGLLTFVQWQWRPAVSTVSFVLAAILMVVNSRLDLADRKRLIDIRRESGLTSMYAEASAAAVVASQEANVAAGDALVASEVSLEAAKEVSREAHNREESF